MRDEPKRGAHPGDNQDGLSESNLAWMRHGHQWLATRKVAPRSRLSYEYDLRALLRWCETHDLSAAELRTPDFFKHYNDRRASGISDATVTRQNSTLKSYFEWLAKKKLIPDDPLADVEHNQRTHGTTTPVSLDQLRALWDVAATPRDRAVVGLLGINALKVDDIVEANFAQFVVRQGHHVLRLDKRRGRLVLDFTILSSEVASDILAQAGNRSTGRLFMNEDGAPIQRRSVTRIIQRLARAAGLPSWVTPISLSHAMRLIAIEHAFSYPSVARAAGEMNLQALPQLLSGARIPFQEHAAVRMANLVIPRSRHTINLHRARLLLEDGSNPPTVAAVLAASTLEHELRETARRLQIQVSEETAKMSTYGEKLRAEGAIRAADIQLMKRIEETRNWAAHGWFDRVDVASAEWVIREVEAFIVRLSSFGRDGHESTGEESNE